jgi:hypothetical protein
MSEDDFDYYRRRAEQEAELALQARHANAAQAHRQLAGYYRRLAEEGAVAAPRRRRLSLRLVAAA